jgi:hypothetical protein
MSALRDAIVQHLQGDSTVTDLATGGIYPGLPPESDQSFPFVSVTAHRGNRPERVFQGIAFEEEFLLVKAIDRSTSPKVVGEINAAIRASLDSATPTINGAAALNVMWAGDVCYDEQENGQQYQHEGGIYQVWADPS